ncbi:MAG: FAD-dependent thymidylate synthase [Gaiellaceae bacterium]
MATTDRVIADGTIQVLDHGFVRLDAAMADDLSVANAARVSFARRKEALDEADEGLIRFLMRDRHGCYDDASEVLTSTGWKPWPEVTGAEIFATRSRDGRLEYQSALRVVHKEYRGHMIGFKGPGVDMLVTPDHRVLAAPTCTLEVDERSSVSLVPAHSVLWRPHRHVTTAAWQAPHVAWLSLDGLQLPAEPLLALLGLFIGGGRLSGSSTATFRPRIPRQIAFLRRAVHDSGLELRECRDETYAVPLPPEVRVLFAECSGRANERVIPARVLWLGAGLLESLLEGLTHSEVATPAAADEEGGQTYVTPGRLLADQVQELALKLGRTASLRAHVARPGDGRQGPWDRWLVRIDDPCDRTPELCATREQALSQMGVETYDGAIHCVEVPNHTLYVRRNGCAVWSGNTPFEHNALRFHIRCPIFVAREWFRHRIGSFNEFSMRYAKATDDFYLPEPEDVRTQVGKPGAYTFDPVAPELAEEARDAMRELYEQAFTTYERLVEKGVAREVARAVLPVGAYTEFYWTVNARALMNFVSLRAAETAQREIRRYADAVESFLAERMPVTHAAFVAGGRVAP